jgi:hypothetical protein
MIFDNFAETLVNSSAKIFCGTAIYTPVSGNSVECSVRVDHDVILQPDSYNVTVVETGTVIEGFVSEIGEPRHGSIFVKNGITYTVKRIESNDGRYIRLVVK